MTEKKSQLPMKLLRLMLLLLSLFAHLSAAESKPFAYMCDRTAELHVIWTDSRNSSHTSGARLCLYNQNQDSQPIVLTNATMSEVHVPNRRWHLAFGIPSNYMTCKYYYKWKIEPLSSVAPASSDCSSATPAEYCEVELGRSQLCPNSPSHYNTPLECMVFPANFTFLRDLCEQEPTEPPTERPPPIWAVALGAAGLVIVALLLLLLLRWRRRKLRKYSAPSDAEVEMLQQPAVSVFCLLSDRYQVRRFVEHHSSTRGNLVPQQCVGFAYLLVDPDTGARIQLDPVPAA